MRVDGEGGLGPVSPQIPQSHWPGQEGADQATGIEEMNLAIDGLFGGSSLGRHVDGVAALIY
jgi:hypothetical protein